MHYHRNTRDEFIEYLAEKFPKCFFVDPPQRRPLKHSVIDDLEKENVLDREKLAQALDWYKSHFSYEYALIAGSERVDLNGKKAGTVTPAEQREARARVAAQKRELRERQQIPPPPTVSANTAKINGAVVTKAVSPSLHPLLADMQSAIGIVSSILTDKQYEALRPALAAAALKEIIDRAERLSHEVNPT